MQILGIDTSKSGFCWSLLQSAQGSTGASVIASAKLEYPTNVSRASGLGWIHQELTDIQTHYHIDGVAIKRAEVARNMTNSVLERAQVDGVVLATFGTIRIDATDYPWKSIAALLGHKNRDSVIAALRSAEWAKEVPVARLGSVAVAMAHLMR
jgi:Holliday junction resolvasome RuvABC endonuclease subunit